jgi:hypothetical protein
MTNLTLNSPELTSLNQTMSSLKAKASGYKTDATILNQRILAGSEDTADNDSNIAMILAGGDIELKPDLKAQLAQTMKQWRVVDDAIEVLSRKINKAKREAAIKVVAGLKPEHDAIMARLCASLVEAHHARAKLWVMKRAMIDNEIGVFGDVCELLPDEILGLLNPYSSLAAFLRESVKLGFLKSAPAQLR